MKKRILFVVIIALLFAGSGICLKYYPAYRAYQKLTQANHICFEGTYHITNSDSFISGSLFELLQDGKIEGECTDGILHCFLYTDTLDTALLEFYRDTNGAFIINIRQMIEYGVDYITENTGLPAKQLFNFIDHSLECYVSEQQFEAITGITILPSIDAIDNFSKFLFTNIVKSNKIIYADNQYILDISDQELPFDLSITLTVPDDEYNIIEVPKSSIEDDQIWVYQKVYQIIMDVVDNSECN